MKRIGDVANEAFDQLGMNEFHHSVAYSGQSSLNWNILVELLYSFRKPCTIRTALPRLLQDDNFCSDELHL